MTADRDKRLEKLANAVYRAAFEWMLTSRDEGGSCYAEVHAFHSALAALLAAAKDVTK